MRKFYTLLFTVLSMFYSAGAQDLPNFLFNIGPSNNVNFTNTSVLSGTDPKKAHWFFGDGTKQITGPLAGTQHQYSLAGTYQVCLKIYTYNNQGTDSILTGHICKTLILPSFTPDTCKANFTDTSSTTSPNVKLFVAQPWHINNKKPEKICWNFGDGQDTCIIYNPALPSDYAIHHLYSTPGTYNVCIKIWYQGGCIASYCRIVSTGNSTGNCSAGFNMESISSSPLSKKFIAIPWHSLQKKPVKVCWVFGDGQDTCIQYTNLMNGPYTVSHTYPTNGQYNVCVKIFYDGGCHQQSCHTVTIGSNTTPGDSCYAGVHELTTSLTQTERKFYAALNPNKVVEKICWIFGDGQDSCVFPSNPPTQQQLSMTHVYPSPGTYQLCMKVWYSGGCVVQKCKLVTIHSGNNQICGGYITDSLISPHNFQFKGYSIHGPNDNVLSWHWSFGDGSYANTQNATHNYQAPGIYDVCLTIKTTSGCITKICKKINLQVNSGSQITLAPNPVLNTLHVGFHSAYQQQVTINIFNANGILVKTFVQFAMTGSNNWSFDVSTLPPGIYSVVIQSPNQLASAVFIKQ